MPTEKPDRNLSSVDICTCTDAVGSAQTQVLLYDTLL